MNQPTSSVTTRGPSATVDRVTTTAPRPEPPPADEARLDEARLDDEALGPAAAYSPSVTQMQRDVASGRSIGQSNRGWIWAAVWLAYLVPTVSKALELEGMPRRIAGLVIVAVFGVGYIWIFVVTRSSKRRGHELSTVFQVSGLVAMTALVLAACVVIGQPGSSLAVYLAVSAMMVIDWRAAWGIVCLIMFAVAVADRLVHGWVADDGLVFSIFLAALAVWGITQMIVRNQQLALAHDEIARLAVAQERTRFARDMHDLLGHSLTVVTVKAELAGRLVSIDPERAEREINDVERLARDALADVRAAVGGYREVSLAKELVNARTALEAAGIEAEVPNALDDVPGDRRELFGWAVREGVTNVLRHSGARHCRIELGPDGIEIVDDGVGPAQTSTGSAGQGTGGAVPTGNGLVGLRERADAAGSRVSVGRATLDGGFRLRVSR